MKSLIASVFGVSEVVASNASRLVMSITLLAAAAATLGVSASGALFTDSASLGSNSFTSGSVDIAASPASAAFSVGAMAPGDTVTATLTVNNSGSLQQRYAMTSITTEDTLAAQLDMTVKTGVVDCSNAGFGASGTVLYGPGDLGSTAETAVIGDAASGAQTGDRTVVASGSEELCVQVSLPSGTGNSFQGLSTAASFSFYAEQTANN